MDDDKQASQLMTEEVISMLVVSSLSSWVMELPEWLVLAVPVVVDAGSPLDARSDGHISAVVVLELLSL